MKTIYGLLLLFVVTLSNVAALDNGVALTPPMGWLSWERFRCNTDCKNFPKTCISERLYMDMADVLVSGGYINAGYKYVNIDDCWSAKNRTADMKLVADPERFPHGMKALADYIHSKGLKIGIYGDMGRLTCGGYPGSKFTMEQDAQTFADWGIDSFKMDGCYSTTDDYSAGYPIMEGFLNRTGRPILFSCSWPAYKHDSDYKKIAKYCNIWRNFDDIDDSWQSVKKIIKYFGDDKYNFSSVSAPGSFNDPDMLVIGNNGLSFEQEKVQMAMWSMMAAPLYLSCDLRNVAGSSRAVIFHKGAIAINQDKLGIMGRRFWQSGNFEGWSRPILPKGSYAIAILNFGDGGYYSDVSVKLSNLGVQGSSKLQLTDVFTDSVIGNFTSSDTLNLKVDEQTVFFGKLKPF